MLAKSACSSSTGSRRSGCGLSSAGDSSTNSGSTATTGRRRRCSRRRGAFDVAPEKGLEGIVAKRAVERYPPGERAWVKVKNRDYWRYPLELDAVLSGVRRTPLSL